MVFTRDWVEVFDFRYFVPRSNLSHRGKVGRQLRQTVRQDRFEIFVCEFRKWQSQDRGNVVCLVVACILANAGAFAVTAGRALRLHLETVIQILYMYREQADESERL